MEALELRMPVISCDRVVSADVLHSTLSMVPRGVERVIFRSVPSLIPEAGYSSVTERGKFQVRRPLFRNIGREHTFRSDITHGRSGQLSAGEKLYRKDPRTWLSWETQRQCGSLTRQTSRVKGSGKENPKLRTACWKLKENKNYSKKSCLER